MQNLKHQLNHRLAFFLPFMLLGLALGLIDLPFTASMLLSTIISLVILWLLSRQLTAGYDPKTASSLQKAALSLLAGFIFSMFWAATSWFSEGSLLLEAFPSGMQAVIVGGVSLGLVLAIWKTFSKCVVAVFGDIIREFGNGKKRKNK